MSPIDEKTMPRASSPCEKYGKTFFNGSHHEKILGIELMYFVTRFVKLASKTLV
jgi:hypothetical protein